jgi:RND family efflux transporter MFP subunit
MNSHLARKASLWLALLGVLSGAAMVHRTTRTEPMPPPPTPPVQRPAPDSLGAAGIVESLRENTSVGVPVAALVKAVHVQVWDRVEPGALLLELDDRELRARLPTEEAELRVQETELRRLRRLADRTRALHAHRLVSDEDADAAADALAVQEARTDVARGTLAATRAMLERLVIRAPVGGTVLQLNTRPGEHVAPGSATPPLLLGSVSEFQVRAEVDEQLASQVRPERPAVGYLKGDASQPIDLTFLRIEPFVVPKRNLTGASAERVDTRVLRVVYRFANAQTRPIYVGQQMDLFLPRQ